MGLVPSLNGETGAGVSTLSSGRAKRAMLGAALALLLLEAYPLPLVTSDGSSLSETSVFVVQKI